jgi:DNA polymerase-3 subunit beta
MKILLERDSLLAALQLVAGAVERRQTLPILSHVLLSFNNNSLRITATDLEIELIAKVELPNNVEATEITVPARKFIDLCKALPNGADLEIPIQTGKIVIRSGSSRFTLATLQASEFPKVEQSRSQIEFTIPQSILKHLLDKTYFTMAHQDVRYFLNGMLLDIKPDTLQTVATDGHRLALAAYSTDFKISEPMQVIVPRKAVLELMRLLEENNDEIKVVIGTNHIHVEADNFTFTSKLVDGKFPDYKRVIPKNTNKLATIDRSLFKDALSRAAILCNEKFHGVRILMENNSMSIQANNVDQEEAEEKVGVNYDGEKLDIGFNVTYLLDALGSLPDGEAKLSMSDSNSSVLIEHADSKDCMYVVMPMRL